jgi:hypothetical protein
MLQHTILQPNSNVPVSNGEKPQKPIVIHLKYGMEEPDSVVLCFHAGN